MTQRLALRVLSILLLVSIAAENRAHAQALPEEFEAKLGYETGQVSLPGGIAVINLPESFRFLGPEGSRRLLTQGWGNPPEQAEGVMGMLVPADVSPLSPEGWGVVITYEEDGYIDDSDAADIDYTKLLAEMKAETDAANEERKKAGFEAVTLIGWAEPPSYDAAEHKLYWAKELAFAGSDDHTLNYGIRILGRKGVLVLNAVAGIDQLDSIREPAKGLLSAIDFKEGLRYRDYIQGDKVASYGVTALIAGGAGAMAVKTGLLKKFWKLILLGLAALGGALKRFFSGRTKKEDAAAAPQG
ncbi:MAG TPA: DUF2167 domain-containing protein [Terriglobia bacterium]|nr:DUF2167 domain-containing protein [Terriglobia bacterium]